MLPGFEKAFPAGTYTGEKVTVDGNIITASGMGQALPFALAVLKDIAGEVAVEKVREGIQRDPRVAIAASSRAHARGGLRLSHTPHRYRRDAL